MRAWTAAIAIGFLFLSGCTAGLGDDCRSDGVCGGAGLYCCAEGKCGRGMCTSGCASDRDCPSGAYCEGRICWQPCDDDGDCADHLRCKSRDGRRMCRGD
ncbi:MAG: hypothetical protein JWM10_2373 [Myxococcaceae bacterium]|nr:hypothetical protein [Myxococcaceae bacterium]